jgi:hypothetical protein
VAKVGTSNQDRTISLKAAVHSCINIVISEPQLFYDRSGLFYRMTVCSHNIFIRLSCGPDLHMILGLIMGGGENICTPRRQNHWCMIKNDTLNSYTYVYKQ